MAIGVTSMELIGDIKFDRRFIESNKVTLRVNNWPFGVGQLIYFN